MIAGLTTIFGLIQQVLPLISGSTNLGLVGPIIKTLEEWMPIVVNEVDTLYDPVKAIITGLKSKNVTAEQIEALRALDEKADAAFEAAAQGMDPDA